jgi:hypothetical protein
MRSLHAVLLVAFGLAVASAPAQSVVLAPSLNVNGALCLARITLDANDVVESIAQRPAAAGSATGGIGGQG